MRLIAINLSTALNESHESKILDPTDFRWRFGRTMHLNLIIYRHNHSKSKKYETVYSSQINAYCSSKWDNAENKSFLTKRLMSPCRFFAFH